MKTAYLSLLLTVLMIFSIAAGADDAFSELGAGGLVFGKSTDISMDKEVLEISPNLITVSYEFKNNSDKNINAIIAFPLPPIKCGWFDRASYPDHFVTTVDGTPVHPQIEEKAFVRNDSEGASAEANGFKMGADVTVLLKSHSIPVDCRLATPKGRWRNIAPASYERAAHIGLAFPDIKNNPYSIYYETDIKYFWNQQFPARSTVHITHSYRPAYGAGQYAVLKESYPIYWDNLSVYRDFFATQSKLKAYLNDLFMSPNPDASFNYNYRIVRFILKSENSWEGPIKEFRLVLPKPPCFVVTSIRGSMSMNGDDIVIQKTNYSPTDDLEVFYIWNDKEYHKLLGDY